MALQRKHEKERSVQSYTDTKYDEKLESNVTREHYKHGANLDVKWYVSGGYYSETKKTTATFTYTRNNQATGDKK